MHNTHKFAVGQTVDLMPMVLRHAAEGKYEVLSLVPPLDNNPHEPRYRIKSKDEKHERIAPESELTASESEMTASAGTMSVF